VRRTGRELPVAAESESLRRRQARANEDDAALLGERRSWSKWKIALELGIESNGQHPQPPSREDIPMGSRSCKRTFYILLIAMVAITVSCARQPDPSQHLSPEELKLPGQLAGFLVGLFHGLTIVVNMIAALFFDVRIYAFPNSGRLYDLGFVLGAAAALGGIGRAARSRDDAGLEGIHGETVVMGLSATGRTVLRPAISATCPSCGHQWLMRLPGSR
jgi:hypothetical protein